MNSVDDHTRPARWHWEQVSEGVSRFVPAGVLDFAVLADLVAELAAVPPGPTQVIHIDLGAVTFLDARTAGLLARYRETAQRLGREVRIVNAAGMPRKVLAVLGVLPPELVADPAGNRLSRPRRQSVPDRWTMAGDVFARARNAIARAHDLYGEAERLREAHQRHARG